MIALRCSSCGQGLEVADLPAGKTLNCPYCGQPLAARSFADQSVAPSASAGAGGASPAGGRPPPPTIDAGAGMKDTGSPFPTEAAPDRYDFLSPPRSSEELGWLAHYRVVMLLGQGGMGLVFRAEDTLLRRPVALKVMKPELARNPDSRQRFLREARAMAAVRSDHVVTIHQVGENPDAPFLAMELLQGKPLNAWDGLGRRATLNQVLDLGLQIARGLEAAHKTGLIHRDIKPSNLWIEEGTGRVKILDFGLARSAGDDAQLTQTGVILGTPAYMAPEQADGSPADARSDLFSLGCVLYEFAAGQPPFMGASSIAVLKAAALKDPAPLQKLNPAVSPELADLVKRLLAKKPDDRPRSATVVVAALQGMAAAQSPTQVVASSGDTLTDRADGSPRRSKRGLWIGAAAGLAGLLFLAAGGLYLSFPWGGERGPAAPNAPPTQPPRPSTARGVTDSEVLLGMSAPFSGQAQELGRQMELGIQTYFHSVNDRGGVAGRKLTLVALDDGYEPDRALANMKELFEKRGVFAVIGNVGTPTAEKTLPYALEKRLLFFGGFTGASLLRKDPPDRYVFNYRAGYEEETAAIVKYLVEIKKIRPEEVAVFAQQDGYGDAGFRGVARSMRKYGRDPDQILRVGHPRNSVEIADAVKQVTAHKEIRAVVMVSTYRPAARFIQAVKEARPEAIFANVSFVGGNALAEELRQLSPKSMEGVVVSQVVPYVDSQSSAVMKFRELLATYQPNEHPSSVTLEGYIDGAVLAEGLRRAGDDLTTDVLIDALESIRNYDLGIGAPINYGPSEHQGSHKVWGTVLDKSGTYQVLELE